MPLPVTPRPAAASPGARRPPSEPAPAATIKPSAVIRPSAVIQPSAVLQPSAVIMPGGAPVATTRPAVVLPASAQAPYGTPGNAGGGTTPGPTTPGIITNPAPHADPQRPAIPEAYVPIADVVIGIELGLIGTGNVATCTREYTLEEAGVDHLFRTRVRGHQIRVQFFHNIPKSGVHNFDDVGTTRIDSENFGIVGQVVDP